MIVEVDTKSGIELSDFTKIHVSGVDEARVVIKDNVVRIVLDGRLFLSVRAEKVRTE